MLALSVRQPFAWAIIHAGKDIENRTWTSSQRGRIAIHAAKGMTSEEYWHAAEFMRKIAGAKFRPTTHLDRGGIIGTVELVDIVTESSSPWFEGPYGLVLRDPRQLPFQPCKGKLGFFEVGLF